MKALKTTLATLLLVVAADAADHDERRVPLDEVTIKSNKYSAEATLSVKDDGSLGLTILMNGKPVVIPERALASIKDAWVGSVMFCTETPTGVPVSEWKLKSGIILSFNYGDKITQGMPKNPTEVRAGCRIKISAEGNYERIETAVPQEIFEPMEDPCSVERWKGYPPGDGGIDQMPDAVDRDSAVS